MDNLIANGIAKYGIAVLSDAPVKVRFAADELVYFLALSTDVTLPVVGGKKERCIVLEIDPGLSPGGAVCAYRLNHSHERLTVTGDCADAVLYGVYELLHRLIGLEIFADDCFVYEKKSVITISDFALAGKPDIPVRSVGIFPVFYDDAVIDNVYAPRAANVRYAYRMRLTGMREGWGLSGHTYFKILPPSVYRETHPDWYSPDGKNLCLSSASMRAEFVSVLAQMIEQNPDLNKFMLGQEDNAGFCDCPACRAAVNGYGGFHSAVMLRFTNDVVAERHAWRAREYPARRVEFCTFAYHRTSPPPVKIVKKPGKIDEYRPLYPALKTEKNLGVMLAPLATHASLSLFNKNSRLSFDTKYRSSKSVPTRDLFYGWRAMTDNLYIWSYSADFVDYLTPFHLFGTVGENYRGFASLCPRYVFEEGAYSGYTANLTELKIYVFSKLMQDSRQDVDTLVSAFISAYYGPGAAAVKAYYDIINAHCRTVETTLDRPFFFIRFDDFPDITEPQFWPESVLRRALCALLEGIKAAQESGRGEYARRIEKETLSMRYLLLRNYADTLTAAELNEQLNAFTAITKAHHIVKPGESPVYKLEELIAKWKESLRHKKEEMTI